PSLSRSVILLFSMPRPPSSTLFPYTTLFRSGQCNAVCERRWLQGWIAGLVRAVAGTWPHWGNRQALRRVWHAAWLCRSPPGRARSEEHTSELQSRENLVCRLLLEKKKKTTKI